MSGPVLFFDFDNTITQGDLLDAVIARFSKDDSWRECEAAWQAGRISTRECLTRQIGNLRPARAEILEFAAGAAIDPYFVPIVRKAAAAGLELTVLSDSFTALIDAVLRRNDIPDVRVIANDIRFLDDRAEARFPHLDPSCPRCAHCKAQHFRALEGRETVFVGDGLSDLCAGNVADVVFAKDSLAAHLSRTGKDYLAFDSLRTVLDYLARRGY
jgi:2,3-diketo-5-methylthio-1-phosphopentane phosphatase